MVVNTACYHLIRRLIGTRSLNWGGMGRGEARGNGGLVTITGNPVECTRLE